MEPSLTPPWLDEVLVLAIKILSPVILLLTGWAIRKLTKKLSADEREALARIAKENVKRALDAADAWAKTQATKPSSESKLENALSRLIELEAVKKVTPVVRDALAKRVEEALMRDLKEDKHVAIE